MSDDYLMTVQEVGKLIRDTREAIARADELMSNLSSHPPPVLSDMIEPTLRIRESLLTELEKLEKIASAL